MTVSGQLASLEAADLVRTARLQPELEYVFRHALVQEAAYESLLRNNRRMLHLTIGEVLEQLYPDRLDEFAPVLGNHFDEGEDYQRALEYFARAGDMATQRYANAEAEMHYRRALAIVTAHKAGAAGAPTLQELYLKLGRALELTGRYDDALAHYSAMQSDAQLRGDQALELAAMTAQSIIHSAPTLRFDPPKAQSLSSEALAIARALGDESAEARLLWHASLVQKFLGHWAEHVRLGKQAAQIARRLGDRELLAYVLNDIGEGLVTVEQLERGVAALDEAHEWWLAANNTPMLIDNRCNLSYAYFVSGQFQPAKKLAHEAHTLSERTHNLWGIVYSAVLFGYICRESGETAVALDALHEAFRLGQQSGFGLALWFAPTMLALISLDLGDPAGAMDFARAGENSVTTGFLYAKGFVTAAHLLANIALADFKRAEAVRPEAEAFLFADEMYSRSQVTYALAEFALTMADYVRALAIADEMLESLRPGTVTVSVPWLLFQKARALLGLSRHAEARVVLEQARQIAGRSEQRTILWRILTALADLTVEAAEAQSLREQARELVNFIMAHTPDELRATFLARPDVQTLLAPVEVSP